MVPKQTVERVYMLKLNRNQLLSSLSIYLPVSRTSVGPITLRFI